MSDEQIRKKEWLNRGFNLRIAIAGKRAIINERKSRAEYSGIQYDKNGSTGSSSNSMQNKIDSVLDVEEEYEDLKRQLIAVETEVKNAIDNVSDPVLKSILEQHYLGYVTLVEIGKTIGYHENSVKAKHKEALDAIKIVPDCT